MEAVDALSKAERYSIGLALWLAGHHDRTIRDYVKGDSDEWVSVLAQLVNAASVAVGASSQAPVLGKLNVNHKDWPLLNFVQQLWQLTREFGGGLNYSRKNGIGGGSLMSALHFLKPLLPSGMLDNPPYAAIETLIRVQKSRTARQEVVPVPF